MSTKSKSSPKTESDAIKGAVAPTHTKKKLPSNVAAEKKTSGSSKGAVAPTHAKSTKKTKAPDESAKHAGAPTHSDRSAKLAGKERPRAEALRSRIVGHADVSPDLIKPHSLNYRKHGSAQVSALSGSMNDLGWVKSILVSQRTNTIIDGHARWEEAVRRKLPTVPVEYVDLSKDEENKALALLDPITEMATRDDALFAQLLDSIQTDNEAVNATLEKLSGLKDKPLEIGAGEVPTSTKILEYTTDVFFPSTSKWGIPDLLPEMLYDGDCPTTTWPYEDNEGHPQFYVFGEGGFDERVTGRILTFYADDWRFERIWSESVDTIRTVVPLKPLAACQPDFSLWGSDPLVVQMWNLYRARWISRYWQEAGIKLIPSLACSFFPACYEFISHGLPKDIPVASMQIRSDGMKSKQHVDATIRDIEHYLSDHHIGKIILYGTTARKVLEGRLPKGPEYIWCKPFSDCWFENGQKIKAEKKAANLLKIQQKGQS